MMNKIKNFFMGRYGMDQLYRFIMVIYIILLIISMITGNQVYLYVAFALFILQMFRALSKNFTARRKENDAFLKLWNPVKYKFENLKKRFRDKTHRYLRCPKCKTEIRVPKNKGKIRITCPKCSEQFIRTV